jgi:hypothetical protein
MNNTNIPTLTNIPARPGPPPPEFSKEVWDSVYKNSDLIDPREREKDTTQNEQPAN